MTRRLLAGCVAGLGLLIAYLVAWPVPIQAEAWNAPKAPAHTGPYTPNQLFERLHRVNIQQGHGPEDVAIDNQGRVYGGLADGRIMRWTGQQHERFANTGGRPLGMDMDQAGNLWVADAVRGLLRISPNGAVNAVVTQVAGQPLVFADDVCVSPSGKVYFTDASTQFAQPQWKLDIIQNQPKGRLLVYDPKTHEASVVLDALYFANGVAVDPSEQFVLVSETSRYRVRKVWITGPRQGEHRVLIDNLPGFPDGISTGSGGIFWIALASPRNALLDALSPYPFARHMIIRLPKLLQPGPARTTQLMGIDAEGQVHHYGFDPTGQHLTMVTSVQEHGHRLYLGSLTDTAWAWMNRPTP